VNLQNRLSNYVLENSTSIGENSSVAFVTDSTMR